MIWVLASPAQGRAWAEREGLAPGDYEHLRRWAQVEEVDPTDRVVEIISTGRKTPLALALALSMVPVLVEKIRL